MSKKPHRNSIDLARTLAICFLGLTLGLAEEAAGEPACKLDLSILDYPFWGGEPPLITGLVTSHEQAFQVLYEKSAAVERLHHRLVQEAETYGRTSVSDPILYLTYDRASKDISGSGFSWFECKQAKSAFFDLLEFLDPTGITEFSRWFLEGSIRGAMTERLAFQTVVQYKLSARSRDWPDSNYNLEDDDYLTQAGPLKVRVPHPDNPKGAILHALAPVEWFETGKIYDFTLTSTVGFSCIGPPVICSASEIQSFLGYFRALGKGELEKLAAAGVLKLYRSSTGLSTTADEAAKKILKESSRNVYRDYFGVGPLEAVDRVKHLYVTATVPDLRRKQQCTAIKILEARGLSAVIEYVFSTDPSKNTKVADTDPRPWANVDPGTVVTLKVKNVEPSQRYPCGDIKATYKSSEKGI